MPATDDDDESKYYIGLSIKDMRIENGMEFMLVDWVNPAIAYYNTKITNIL